MNGLVFKSSKGNPIIEKAWHEFYNSLGITIPCELPETILINDTEYANVVDVFGNDFTAFLGATLITDIRYFVNYKDSTYISPRGILIVSEMIRTKAIDSIFPKTQKIKYKTYLVKDTKSGLIKIGKANNPESRIASAFCKHPHMELIFVCDDNIETLLHQEFNDCRANGEWFNISESDLNKIVSKYNFKKC